MVRGPGEQSAWGQAFEAENKRRARELRETEALLNSRDKEPGRPSGNDHEIVWLTRDVGACPVCRKAYRRVRLQGKDGMVSSVQAATELDEYLGSTGLYDKALKILHARQEQRKLEEHDKGAKKRAGPVSRR